MEGQHQYQEVSASTVLELNAVRNRSMRLGWATTTILWPTFNNIHNGRSIT